MKRSDLSAEDLALLNTDFGEMDKEAAAQVELADEMYLTGFDKLATETADAMDQAAAELLEAEKVASEEDALDEESEKMASELSCFIERGFFDGLRKLGSERHDDELHYLMPYIEEKVAATGAKALLGKFRDRVKGINVKGMGAKAKELGAKAKNMGGKAVDGVSNYHKDMGAKAKAAVTGKNSAGAAMTGKERAVAGGKSLAKASPYLALGAGGAFAATRGNKQK